jgi:hypothetical protein
MTQKTYQNFKVAIYARAYEVDMMRDLDYLKSNFEVMSRQMHVDKVYLETHRDLLIPSEDVIVPARDYLRGLGVEVAGGITVTVNERNRFQTYCYTNPEDRLRLKDICAYTARLFDEFILDDFFFTNCKCPSCIAAKGQRSWTDFRLELMDQAAQELVLEPARSANPKVKVVIKYPNWYEHFQGLGFNLDAGPRLFDGVYTGTETRDPVMGNQHLQPYHGYLVFRYFENLKPGGNGGGWVDPFGSRYLDRYAEQFWLTLFAKAPEQTLFDFRSIQRPIQEADRAPWQGQGTSFDFDAVMVDPSLIAQRSNLNSNSETASHRPLDVTPPPPATLCRAAGAAFELVDRILGKLGQPLGLKIYKPFHSTGEDFLPGHLGMLGIPLDLVPQFPFEAQTVLLTQSASFDPEIVTKIKRQLLDGKTVVVTSGLLHVLQESGRGLDDIVELRMTHRKLSASEFQTGWFTVARAERPILVPIIHYLTNDSWEEISCRGGTSGTPLLHSAGYGGGMLYVLVIPDSYDDLYALPPEVLTRIKELVAKDLSARLEAPSQVALFAYDNDAWIAESFRDETVEARLVVDAKFTGLEDLLSGETLSGEELLDWRGQKTGQRGFSFTLKPHSWRAFRGVA